MEQVPVFGPPPAERADAARNRRRILEVAEVLFEQNGVGSVSMDQVAEAAKVGKGTLYRRFGDKAGLGVAILDLRERDIQTAILRGRPPLGPGAPPAERLHAFVDAYLDYLARNLDLVVMCETAAPGARYRSGVYAGWRRHIELLLAACGTTGPRLRAELLLATLDGDLHRSLGKDREYSPTTIRRALHELVNCLALGGPTIPRRAGVRGKLPRSPSKRQAR